MITHKWDILVPACTERLPGNTELFAKLHRQVQEHGNGQVNIIILMDDARLDLKQKRNELVKLSTAEYVSFIDDDDDIADDYVSTILPLLDGVDYIGFELELWTDGVRQKPVSHSLDHKGWSQDEKGFYRGISHLNPIKTSILREFPFDCNFAEDEALSRQIEESGKVKTQHYIAKPIYFYYANAKTSVAWRRRNED